MTPTMTTACATLHLADLTLFAARTTDGEIVTTTSAGGWAKLQPERETVVDRDGDFYPASSGAVAEVLTYDLRRYTVTAEQVEQLWAGLAPWPTSSPSSAEPLASATGGSARLSG
jgi:hypothetical protein